MNQTRFRIALLALGFLVLQLGIASACAPPSFKVLSSTWGANSTHVSAGPGQSDVPLTITLESYGSSCSVVNVEGLLDVYGGFSNYNGTGYPEYFTQSLQPYSISTMTFYLNIGSTLTAGPNQTFTYPFYLSFNYTNSTQRNTDYFPVSIPLKGTPELSFNVNDHALVAGQLNNVTVEVTNYGTGTASDIVSTFQPTSSLNLVSQPVAINSLAPGYSANLTLPLYVSPSLIGQDVSLDLDTHYISPYGYNTSADSVLDMYGLSTQGSISVTSSTEDLVSGELDYMSIIIKNNGASAIDNLSVTLTPGSSLSLIGYDGLSSFTQVGPGENVTIPIELYESSSSSTVSTLDVQLSYDGQTESSPRVLSFLTPGYINITEVSTTLLPATPVKGGIFSLTSTLNNLGTAMASSAQVTVEAPKGLTVIGANTTFIGSLSTDTPTAFTVSFRVSPTGNTTTYKIPVVLTYSNNLNQRVNQTLDYLVDIGASNSLTGNFITSGGVNSTRYRESFNTGPSPVEIVVVIVIIVAIAGGAFYFYKKRAKKVNAK